MKKSYSTDQPDQLISSARITTLTEEFGYENTVVSPKFRSASFLMTATEELGAIAVTQKHILLVDDEPNLLNTIEFILEAANYRVSTAADGQKGLAKLLDYQKNNIQVDLLITDIRMPRLSGIELIERIKQLGLQIPVMVMSNHGNRSMKLQLKQKGCDFFLDKPVNDDDLLRAIENIIGH